MNARVVGLVLVGLFLVTSSLQAQEKQIKKAMSAADHEAQYLAAINLQTLNDTAEFVRANN